GRPPRNSPRRWRNCTGTGGGRFRGGGGGARPPAPPRPAITGRGGAPRGGAVLPPPRGAEAGPAPAGAGRRGAGGRGGRGWRPSGFTADAQALWQRSATHLTVRSVWLRNSLRGAAALAVAVAVARMTGVSHAFWVALGTLSVLRSNALGTGATALRAVAGTVV